MEYQFTPHNLGFLAIDRIAEQCGVRVENRHCRALTGRACIAAMSREQRDRTLERLREAHPDDWDVLREQIDDAISLAVV